MTGRTRARTWAAAATGIVLGATGLVAAPGAAAADQHLCSDLGGRVEHRRVEGDLVADVSCYVGESLVTGDVLAPTGQYVGVRYSSVKGDVRSTGEVRVEQSTVMGGVVLESPASVLNVWQATVRRSVRGDAFSVVVSESTVEGAVNVATTDLTSVYLSSVGGWVTTHGGFLQVWGSQLGRGLTSNGSGGVAVCASAVAADVAITRSHGTVELGFSADGRNERCSDRADQRNEFLGSLVLTDNPHSIRVGGGSVAGDLVCSGSTGPRGVAVAPDLVVGGARSGDCA